MTAGCGDGAYLHPHTVTLVSYRVCEKFGQKIYFFINFFSSVLYSLDLP